MKGKVSNTGYKKNSKDKNNDYNIIPTNRITMKDVDFPVLGISDKNDVRVMYPGEEHLFDGNSVLEYRIAKNGINQQDQKVDEQLKQLTDFSNNSLKIGGNIKKSNNMKDQILKIAGVKSEKEFYKKYPSEETFMKVHGKAFKKAQLGAAVEKAQGGWTGSIFNQPGIPQEGYNVPTAPTVPTVLQGPSNQSTDYYQNNNPYFATNPGATSVNNPAIGTPAPDAGGSPFDIMPYVGAATSVLGGIQAFGAQKKAKREARMWKKISGLQAQAAESVDVDANRPKNYVRPEDNPVQPNQLFPTYGVGTNVLKRNGGPIKAAYGTEIQNTYAPNTLYDDLGYEPLNDSNQVKQYYHGGHVHQMQAGGFMNFMGQQGGAQALGMLSGAMNDNNAGSQVGSGIGTGIGTAFGGPVGGMVGGALGSMVGGALDKDSKKIKRDQAATQRNYDRVMASQFGKGIHGQYGSYMEEGGQLTNPQLITRFGELDQQDFYNYAHEGMDSLRAGGHLREYTPISERGMEQYAMGGEVKTTWGGHAETISRNPYMPGTGETIMFRGKSHDESDGNGHTGIGVTYGKGQRDSYTDYAEFGSQEADANVEVERGEPAAELQDANGEKNLTVYGNLKIPNQYIDMLGDPKAKGKKFKNYINEISKDEAKQNKFIDKSTSLLNDLDVRNSFDKLKFESLTASINGANMKLKSIADKKKNAAYLQNAINDTAEENGLVADDLARGKIKYDKEALQDYAEYGTTIPKAKDGKTTPPKNDKEARERGFTWTGKYSADGKRKIYKAPKNQTAGSSKKIRKATALGEIPKGQGIDPKTGLSDKITPEQFEAFKQKHNWYDWTGFDPKNANDVDKFAKEFNKKAKAIGSTAEIKPDRGDKTTVVGLQYISPTIDQEEEKTPAKAEEDFVEIGEEKNKTYETTPYKRSKLMDIANMILPFIRPTDQEPLDPRQLSGEMYAMSSNQLEPVQAQGFQPDLATPYDISLQDQMNEITAQTRAAQRMSQGNPAAQSLIAGQAYDAINKVKGEEFRANQAMQSGVYNQNRATLNDAKLKNLDIYDRQYGRQEQAKSNTKAITQAALNSISDKYAKNKLENRTLGVYENLYNYRYDPAGRAINMNPLFQGNIPTLYGKQKNPNMLPVYGPDGTQTGWGPAMNTTSESVVEETTPDDTTDYTPIETTQEEEDVFAPLPKRNGGKTKKKIAMNGSIVKMYKTV